MSSNSICLEGRTLEAAEDLSRETGTSRFNQVKVLIALTWMFSSLSLLRRRLRLPHRPPLRFV